MYILVYFFIIVAIYIGSFKDDFKKEDLQKVVPVVAVCIFLVLLFSLIGSVNKI